MHLWGIQENVGKKHEGNQFLLGSNPDKNILRTGEGYPGPGILPVMGYTLPEL